VPQIAAAALLIRRRSDYDAPMIGRHALYATLCALSLVAGGCGGGKGGSGRPDGAVEIDAHLDDVADSAPDTMISSGPMGDVTVGMQLTYELATDIGERFECRVDDAVFSSCKSMHSITALAGRHTLEVRAIDSDGDIDPTPASRMYNGVTGGGGTRVRLLAGNLTSGNLQAYEAPGTRIFQGLKPDIAMIQEFNVGDNAPATVRAWVDTAFGASFFFFRESGAQIPNGIVSRYQILESGIWQDTESPNREFAYARIDVPGTKDLWAISVHLLTDGSRRPAEATQLVGYINANVPIGDYLVIAGDFNTSSRTETAVNTLGQVVNVAAPFPVDQAGDGDTNAGRSSPYDWVMLDSDLVARQIPVTIGAASFTNGLVFDSRVYAPLADVAPVLMSDSAAVNMQHMGVLKDVMLQ
jgi:endonuclease/exonuclease/phosphatase family metal-dependent hydrolase